MPNRNSTRKGAKGKRKQRDYVVVENRAYGKDLQGTKIYFEGKKPDNLRDDGTIKFGKHILESLTRRFAKFRWIITPTTTSIATERGIVRIRMSQPLLRRMYKEEWERGRDIKNDIVRRSFAAVFPEHFTQIAQ
jgi:hypothetical protein